MAADSTAGKRRHHGFAATRDRILAEARAIMRADGVAALSMQELARRTGMRAPSLYTYFDSKHAIYDEVFRAGMREYRERQDALERRLGFGPHLLGAVIRDYVAFADEAPELFSLLFERPVPGFEPSAAALEEAFGLLADSDRRVRRMLEEGIARPDLPVEQARDVVVVLMHGIAALHRANEPGVGPDEGRFGPLIPHILHLLHSAWGIQPATETKETHDD
jgi:AcrR family transcriptional regulator